MKKLFLSIAVGATLGISQCANAALVNSDFLTAGDDYLVTDTVTDLEWLTPYYTRGHLYNDSFVQGLITNYGFRYATAQETSAMITLNFNNPTTVSPGNTAGLVSALKFFDVFGINENVGCFESGRVVACPRTQGLTSTPSTLPGYHSAYGMIQFGSNGRMIADNPWKDVSQFADAQMGSWLVRPAEENSAQVPAPPTLWLALLGLAGLVSFRKKLG